MGVASVTLVLCTRRKLGCSHIDLFLGEQALFDKEPLQGRKPSFIVVPRCFTLLRQPFPRRNFGDQSLAEFVPALIDPLLIEGGRHPEGAALPRGVEDQLAILVRQRGRSLHMRDQALHWCAETLGGLQGLSQSSRV